uniref:Uncharacterized protein n=1 Tax=Kalanchoe fedtschenkoi TaxID=63787 RepID=A0A7N0V933_KALFE
MAGKGYVAKPNHIFGPHKNVRAPVSHNYCPSCHIEISERKKNKVDDGEKAKKKPRVLAAPPADTGPDPPPDLPESFKERIQRLGGRNPVLVIKKRLFSTDVAKYHNRLEFLKDHERELLDGMLRSGRCEALKPRILDAKGDERIILLKEWEMKKDNGSPSSTHASEYDSSFKINQKFDELTPNRLWKLIRSFLALISAKIQGTQLP